ncbi:MAG: hypothetical protein LBU03_04380 [Tannerellaceae bacterium]|nr:hypothetical protein [Tannerellaceae bacterium]
MSNIYTQRKFGLTEGTPQLSWYKDTYMPMYAKYSLSYKNTFTVDSTPVMKAAFRQIEKEIIELTRLLYMWILKSNPNVDNYDLLAMGLPQRNDEREPVPVPWTHVMGRIELIMPHQMKLFFWDAMVEEGAAKPYGYYAIELFFVIKKLDEEMPQEYDELTMSEILTKSPWTKVFKPKEGGKVFYYAMRWQNTKGEKGPWSPIMSTVIP